MASFTPSTARTVAAYECVMNPSSAQSQRALASQFLEEVKGNPLACRECALELLRVQNTQTRHLGCLLMEAVIKLHWGHLDEPFKTQFRHDVLTLLSSGTRPIGQEERYVKEKIATLAKEVAKRDLPDAWPEFFDALERVSALGDTQRELVVLVIRRLVEDVVQFAHDLSKTRCDALMAELKAKAKAMIGFLLSGLRQQRAAWIESHGQNAMAAHLLVSLMEALQTFISWTPMAVIFDLSVPEMLCAFLSDAHRLRMPAAEALLSLVEQEQGKLAVATKALFAFEHIVLFVSALDSPLGTRAERTAFQQLIGRILVAVGKKHLGFVEKSHLPYPPTYAQYMVVMVRFLGHDDASLCETTLPFFAHLIRLQGNKTTALPVFEQYVPSIASTVAHKLAAGITVKTVHFEDDAGDTGDEEEARERYVQFVSRFSSSLKDLVRKLAALFPKLMLGICATEVGSCMAQLRGVDHSTITTTTHRLFVAMQGCVDLLDAVVRNGVPAAAVSAHADDFRVLLQVFFDFDSSSALLLSLKIRSLRCFSSFYRTAPRLLTSVLERLLVMVLFRAQSEAGQPLAVLSKLTLRVRKEACDSFQRLCVDMPDMLVGQLGPIAAHVTDRLIAGDTSFAEKAVLRDALVGIATALGDVTQQTAFIRQVLGPVLNVWRTESMGATLSDCGKLLEWIGAAPGLQPKWDNARALLSVLETFRTTVKRAPLAAVPLLPEVLPNVFVLCRSLHRLWRPGHAAHAYVRATYPVVFAYDQNLVETLVGRKIERDFGVFFATWLQHVREATYKVIGVSCKVPAFYNIPNLSNVLNNFVFVELADAAIQHVTMLVEYVVDLLLSNCPPEAYAGFLLPLLPQLFQFVLMRLKLCWQLESAIKKGEGSNASAEDEIVQTKLSMDFCRSWFRVLIHALRIDRTATGTGINASGGGGATNGSSGGTQVPSALCVLLITTPETVRGILAMLNAALAETGDNIVLVHVMEILERVMGMLLSDRTLIDTLGGPVLFSLLRAVSRRSNQELVPRALRIVAEVYVRLRGVSALPLEVLKGTGVSAAQVAQLESRLLHESGGASKKTPKNRAQAFAECLGDFVGRERV